MICRLIVITGLFLTARSATGQYFQYSQYNYTAQRINPAAVGGSDYASAGMIYRQQATGSDVFLKSSFLSLSYPLLNSKSGQRWAGFGVTAMDDRANTIFLTQEASVSYAVNIPLTRTSTLSLGMKTLYQQKRLNLDGLFTSAQFIPDHGFDRFKDNGENIGFLKSDFFTLSSGLYWQQVDRKDQRVAYFGISLFDFNRPNDSFMGTSNEINSTFIFHGGVRLFHNEKISVNPELLLTNSASNNVVNAGLITSYFFKPSSKLTGGRIDILTKYVAGRSAIIGLQWHGENFSIGCSRDLALTMDNSANTSAFEVGVELRRLVDHRLKRESLAKKRTKSRSKQRATAQKKLPVKKNKRSINPSSSQAKTKDSLDHQATQQTQHTNLTTVLKQKQDSVLRSAEAGKVNHEPFIIEEVTLHFNFQFNSSDLDEPSSQYLNELSEALLDNSHLKIKLTGHTDNVGSAKFNERLSLYRANSIKAYLVEKGIDATRITTEGKGLTEPLNDNSTDQKRAANRRVELMIMYE